MTQDANHYLDQFPTYLRTLGDDAVALGEVIAVTGLAEGPAQAIAGGLNYLFKSLDLIPDGIDDIGYLDDAFVLRIACQQAIAEDVSKLSPDQLRVLNRLAEQGDVVSRFLEADFERLEHYVHGLRRGAARGRSVSDILADDVTQADFLSDLRAFAQSYQVPRFGREEKNLVKLRAFFDAKLPK